MIKQHLFKMFFGAMTGIFVVSLLFFAVGRLWDLSDHWYQRVSVVAFGLLLWGSGAALGVSVAGTINPTARAGKERP